MKPSIQDQVNQTLYTKLEQGVLPRSPKHTASQLQRSLSTWNEYTWSNQLYLLLSRRDKGYTSNERWTYNWIKKLWWTVKKGEKSTPVLFWKEYKRHEPENENADADWMVDRFAARLFRLFNLDQTTLPITEEIAEREQSWQEQKSKGILEPYLELWPRLEIGGMPSYNKKTDIISIPDQNMYVSYDERLLDLMHEAIHSTWIVTRLNRDTLTDPTHFWSYQYSKEELVAEIWAMYLAMIAGLEIDQDNSVAYVQWRWQRIKKDPKLLQYWMSHWRKASQYIRKSWESEV